MSKLSDVVKNDVAKKTVYDKLVAKVNSIDASTFVLKTKYDTNKSEIKNKIPNTSDLVKKTDYNTKITEIQGKIPDVSSLAAKTTLTAFENNNHNHDKYITTPEFNTLTGNVFNARLAQTI